MIRLVKEFSSTRTALFTLIEVNIKTTVASARLGWVWWFIDPLVMMAIYYFIIHMIFGRGGENYHLFVLTGIVSWQCFSRSISQSGQAILQNRSLIKQIGIPTTILTAVPIFVQIFFAIIGVLIVMVWNYPKIGYHSFAIILLFFLLFILAYAVGLFLSVIEVFAKDAGKVVGYLLRGGFFLSPILYPASKVLEADKVPDIVKQIYMLNPMVIVIDGFRTLLLEGSMFDIKNYLFVLPVGLVLVQLGLLWQRRNTNKVIKMI